MTIAAGDFSPPQIPEGCDCVYVPDHIRVSKDKVACRVVGDSMNKVISNGSVCLFRKYSGGSRNGLIVLVKFTHLQDSDTGSSYTVKEYRSEKIYDDTDSWSHKTITLLPLSDEPRYRPIVLKGDALNHFEVVGVFECVLYR